MIAEAFRPEVVQSALGLVAVGMAYTVNQKAYIRSMFDNQCAGNQIGMKGEHSGRGEVHHRLPQLFAYALLCLTEEQVDSPTNGVLLCQNHHVIGFKADVIHPDQQEALEAFRRGDKDAFHKLQETRQKLVSQGKAYWNDKFDGAMAAINSYKLREYVKKTKLPFPFHKHNGKISIPKAAA